MKNIKVIKSYSSFNQRRYSNPWVAIIDPETGDPDFKNKIGGYTGAFGKGEADQRGNPQSGEGLCGDLGRGAEAAGAVWKHSASFRNFTCGADTETGAEL